MLEWNFAFFVVELRSIFVVELQSVLISQDYLRPIGLRDEIAPHLNSRPCSIRDIARKIKIYFLINRLTSSHKHMNYIFTKSASVTLILVPRIFTVLIV